MSTYKVHNCKQQQIALGNLFLNFVNPSLFYSPVCMQTGTVVNQLRVKLKALYYSIRPESISLTHLKKTCLPV